MTVTSIQSSATSFPPYISIAIKKYGILIIVIAVHIALLFTLSSGLSHPVTSTLPREIFATFITEQPAPQPAPKPAEPKTVPVVKQQVTRPTPRPVVTDTPAPTAIRETQPAPQESQETPPVAATAPAAPSAPATPATPKLISGVSYINAPRPVYPAMDARMGNEGTVTLRVLINEKGRAEKVDVQKSSGSERMDEAARQAVMRALFKPYVEDGKPTPAFAIVPINFTLNR